MTDRDTTIKALLGVLFTPLIFAVPLFLAAGGFDYWQGWVFVTVFSVATVVHTLYLLKFDPDLLRRRMKAGPTAEKRLSQRIIMVFILLSFFLLLIVPAIDHRFGWSHVPAWLVFTGDGLIVFSYVLFYFVFRANRFASATIELGEGQKVVSSGLYGLVRHPMYAGATFLMVGMPLALGSYWGLLILLVALPVLHLRIVDEERFLVEELDGYTDYCQKVKYRLCPGIY